MALLKSADPFPKKSFLGESVLCPSAERRQDCKRVSAQLSTTECSVDTSCGSRRVSQHSSTAAVPDSNFSHSPKRLQTKSVVLTTSERSVQNSCQESEDELVDSNVPFDSGARNCTADDMNRFEHCYSTAVVLVILFAAS